MEHVDTVVVGAGVIGLAVARALATAGRDVLVLERHSRAGEETSSRNSGVIHSGIYYPAGSMKARSCVRGRELLYAYCEQRNVSHLRCGKLVVAQASQVEQLRGLARRAGMNGVGDLQWLDAGQVRDLEPEVRCSAGLLVPCTGIVSVPELLDALQADLQALGAGVFLRADVQSAQVTSAGFELRVNCGGELQALACRRLVNAAGLQAVSVAQRLGGYPVERLPKAFFAKGNYFVCHRLRPFSHLVYPMPDEAGLGVHATLDIDGSLRFGPDVEWIDAPDYQVDERRGDAFYAAIREYWPGLPDHALQPGYAGVRPKLVGPGQAAADFVIEGPADHGVAGLVNLLGIESPGLTSSLHIAERVRDLLAAEAA